LMKGIGTHRTVLGHLQNAPNQDMF
jgi:hypothetical protein